MGKVSDALKKAGKSDGSRLVVRKESVVVRGAATAAPLPHPVPERSFRISSTPRAEPEPAGHSSVVQEPERVKQTLLTGHPEGVAPNNDATQAQTHVAHPADVGTVGRGYPAPSHENPNIAMLRTATPDQPGPWVPPARMDVSEKAYAKPTAQETQPQPARRPIKVSYSETKVQASDPEKLRNNRIFSIFDDIETTNQVKILRGQVLKKLDAIGGNSILMTSANPHEGKTFTSINLGVSIAKEFGRTVLIIDADLRKPTKRHKAFSTDFFSIDVEYGLTDYLKGEADMRDILINPGIERLTLIPGGRPVDNAPELLNSTRMAEMMNEVKTRYGSQRLVIVDGPAMLPFPDAMILAQYVDGVIAVVEMERTPVDQLKKMMDTLKENRILGTVLNKKRDT